MDLLDDLMVLVDLCHMDLLVIHMDLWDLMDQVQECHISIDQEQKKMKDLDLWKDLILMDLCLHMDLSDHMVLCHIDL